MREHACKAVWHTKNAVKHTNVHRKRAPAFPIRIVMIWRKAEPDGPGKSALYGERSISVKSEDALHTQVSGADDHGDIQQPSKESRPENSDEYSRGCSVGSTTDLL